MGAVISPPIGLGGRVRPSGHVTPGSFSQFGMHLLEHFHLAGDRGALGCWDRIARTLGSNVRLSLAARVIHGRVWLSFSMLGSVSSPLSSISSMAAIISRWALLYSAVERRAN